LEAKVAFLQNTILQRYDEKYRKIDILERTLKHVFHNLVDEFGDKTYLLDDLEEEVKNLLHTYINGLKEKVNKLDTTNTHVENEVTFLYVSVDELHEEFSPL
jgi:hypothetical protein